MKHIRLTTKELSLVVLFFLFVIIIQPNVQAQDIENLPFLGTGKQFSPYILSQVCDNCTYVNISKIKYPNSIEDYPNIEMTEPVQGNFNYSFSNTSLLGPYVITTCGDPDGLYSCQSYRIQITTTGSDSTNTIPIFLLIVGFLLLVLAIYEDLPIVGLGSGIVLSIAGAYFLIYGLGIFQDVYTQAIGFTSLFIGLAVAFYASYEAWAD